MTLVAGSYLARGVSGGLGFTRGGKEQVAVELQILDEAFAGETITWFGYFTEGTQERTLETLRTLGWKTDDLDNLDGIADNDVRVVLAEEEYDGKTSLKVKWINKLGGLALKTPMSEEQAKAFARQMKGTVLATAPAGKQASAKPAAPQRQGETVSAVGKSVGRPATPNDLPPEAYADSNDDIPF
jgi:hypothetical protein